jgi:TonB family protein
MSDNKNHITNSLEFQRYLDGKMTLKERHTFEKRLLEDDFESEAMEGFAQFSPEELASDMDKLQKDLNKSSRKNKSALYWRAAAAIALLGIFSFSIFFLIDKKSPAEIAQSKKISGEAITEKPKEQSSDIADSIELSSEPTITYHQDFNTEKKDSAPLRRIVPVEPETQGSETTIVESFEMDTEINDFVIDEIPLAELQKQLVLEPAIEMADEIAEPQITKQADATKKRESISTGGAGANAAMSRSAQKPQSTRTITGRVVSAEDEEGLPGVNVILKGSTRGTISDVEGNYSIDVPAAEDVVLVYSSVGYISEEVAVRDESEMNVAIEPNITSLSEIVVIGYGTQAKKDVTGAISTVENDSQVTYSYIPPMPAGGISSFKSYVKENLRYPVSGLERGIKGTVRLKFTVGRNGQISNMEILKSPGDDFDREAIRLVHEGPKWEPARENDTIVEREVKLKIRFRPTE